MIVDKWVIVGTPKVHNPGLIPIWVVKEKPAGKPAKPLIYYTEEGAHQEAYRLIKLYNDNYNYYVVKVVATEEENDAD